MPETRKPSRPTRDPRIDSSPPSARDETPLARPPASSRHALPHSASSDARVAALEAELERLRAERATEADEFASMLVQIAESDRMRAAAQTMASEARERAGAIQADLDRALQRETAAQAGATAA